MACDPNFVDADMQSNSYKGPYSMFERCMYSTSIAHLMTEYADQFWRAYKNDQKYFMMYFMESHEATGEVIKTVDLPLFNLLNNLKNDGLLVDTTIIFWSDHGLHMHGIFYMFNIEQFWIEKDLPILIIN